MKKTNKETQTNGTYIDALDVRQVELEAELQALSKDGKYIKHMVDKLRGLVNKQNEPKPKEATAHLTPSAVERLVDNCILEAFGRFRREVNATINDTMNNGAEEVVNKVTSVFAPSKQKVNNMEAKFSLLEARLDQLELEHGENQQGNQGYGNHSGLGSTVAGLEYEITLMKSRLGERTLIFVNIELGSLADTILFVNDHLPVVSYGCFFDIVALLDSLRDTQTTTANYAAEEHAAQKSKFLSTSEVSTSASFLHITPLCFAGSKADSTGNHRTIGKSLPCVKHREMWQDDSGVLGLARQLDKEVNSCIGKGD